MATPSLVSNVYGNIFDHWTKAFKLCWSTIKLLRNGHFLELKTFKTFSTTFPLCDRKILCKTHWKWVRFHLVSCSFQKRQTLHYGNPNWKDQDKAYLKSAGFVWLLLCSRKCWQRGHNVFNFQWYLRQSVKVYKGKMFGMLAGMFVENFIGTAPTVAEIWSVI